MCTHTLHAYTVCAHACACAHTCATCLHHARTHVLHAYIMHAHACARAHTRANAHLQRAHTRVPLHACAFARSHTLVHVHTHMLHACTMPAHACSCCQHRAHPRLCKRASSLTMFLCTRPRVSEHPHAFAAAWAHAPTRLHPGVSPRVCTAVPGAADAGEVTGKRRPRGALLGRQETAATGGTRCATAGCWAGC